MIPGFLGADSTATPYQDQRPTMTVMLVATGTTRMVRLPAGTTQVTLVNYPVERRYPEMSDFARKLQPLLRDLRAVPEDRRLRAVRSLQIASKLRPRLPRNVERPGTLRPRPTLRQPPGRFAFYQGDF